MKKILFYIVLWFCKFVSWIMSKLYKKGGSTLPGKIATKMHKQFIRYFKNLDMNKVIMVTGSNGKTSTTNMIAHTLKTAGKEVATNAQGANMISGVATTLIKNSNLKGKYKKEYLVLEIDERSLPAIHKQLPALHLAITNILKDQAQRNGDPDFIYQKLENTINKNMTLYLNNQEPTSKGLEDKAGKVIYYGIDKNDKTYIEKQDFYSVTLPCPKCCGKIEFEYYNIESNGNFKCTNCNFASEKKPDIEITDIDFENKIINSENKMYKVAYALPFYMYCYAVTLAVCKNFGISDIQIEEGFTTFNNPNERREKFTYKEKDVKYLRMKQENPETLQNALNTVAEDKTEKAIFIGLYEVKDFYPAYTNTFYFFDCHFKEVAQSNVEKYICFSKTVSYDCANRMIYDGAEKEKIKIIDAEEDIEAIMKEMDNIKTNNIYLISGMKPYKKIKEFFAQHGDNIQEKENK